MLKLTLTRRSVTAGLAVLAASFPAAAQARVIDDPGPVTAVPSSLSPAVAVNAPPARSAAPAPAPSTADAGFQWGDAGIGAGGTLLLLGGGAAAAGAARHRRGHRPVAG
jgi:hypothetical protein